MSIDEKINIIKILRGEVEVLTKRLKPNGTGHLHTAIGVINSRIDELIKEITAPYFEKEEMKEKYGRAVMTVSEQMQEELEPLPE